MRLLTGFAMMMLAACGQADDPMTLNVNKNKPAFIINLAANPTTGYQWSVMQFDKNLLTLTSSVYQRANTKLIGAGGNMVFTFSLNKGKMYPQATELFFKYARPWDKNDNATVQKVTVNFIGSQ